MNNKIKKINLNHSFIFFFVVNIFCILLFKFNNLNISSILCLLLILIVGVSHGSLDHIKGKKLRCQSKLIPFSPYRGLSDNFFIFITYLIRSISSI